MITLGLLLLVLAALLFLVAALGPANMTATPLSLIAWGLFLLTIAALIGGVRLPPLWR